MIFRNLYRLSITLISLMVISSCQAKQQATPLPEQTPPTSIEQSAVVKSFPQTIVPLTINGDDFIDPKGKKIRFWGMNLTAFYPSHAIADKTAENLSNLGINMVRPHHMMRPSRDWNPQMLSGALVDYHQDSRQFDQDALDKFDYLNAALRNKGIYLAFSLSWSRSYHKGDVNILETTAADAQAWTAAWKEIQSWHWRKQHDVVKSLSLIDERFIAIDQEFTTKLLTHVNPYTKLSYAQDPQLATIEVINEYGAEYTFICNNKFPEYFHNKLQKKWDAFSRNKGVKTSEFYQPKTQQQRMLRLDFLTSLDAARLQRMTKLTRNLGYKGAITYSNLFRGEHLLSLENKLADYSEDHAYAEPFIVAKKEDVFYAKSKKMLKDKPFIISEFNITENKKLREKQQNQRTMLTAATVAYASLQNWSGVTWFSWQHGSNKIGDDGWSIYPDRKTTIGDMAKDEMQLDHFKTAATIFRNGYIQEAVPKIMVINAPYKYDNYHKLMAGKYQYKQGWQNIYAIRKSFAATTKEALKAQKSSNWMNQSPHSPLVSETNQITKDIARKQLTVTAAKAEIFTGYFDGQPPAALKFMKLTKDQGFATIMLTANDDVELIKSKNLLISKTYFELNNPSFFGSEQESDQLPISLKTQRPYSKWQIQITRPLDQQKNVELTADHTGVLKLPEIHWYQAQLIKIQ